MPLSDDDKRQAEMRRRCEEQGHDYENCMTFTFQVYQQCKWCGHIRR